MNLKRLAASAAIVGSIVAAVSQIAPAQADPQGGEDVQQWLLDIAAYAPPDWTRFNLITEGQVICQQLSPGFTGAGPVPRAEIDRIVQLKFANVHDWEHAHSIVNAAILTLCPEYGSQITY